MRTKSTHLMLLFALLTVHCSPQGNTPLWTFSSRSLGIDTTKIDIDVAELARDFNTSRLEIVFRRKGGSVSGPMFIARSIAELAKVRQFEYFTVLSGTKINSLHSEYVIGFSHSPDVDIKKQFNTKASASKIRFLKASDFELFFRPQTKDSTKSR